MLDEKKKKNTFKVPQLSGKLDRKTDQVKIKNSATRDLDAKILFLKQDLDFTKKKLQNEEKSLASKENSFQEMIKGNFKGSLLIELESARKASEQADLLVNALLQQKNELEEQIDDRGGDLMRKASVMKERAEDMTALNKYLEQKVSSLKEQNNRSLASISDLRREKLELANGFSKYQTEAAKANSQRISEEQANKLKYGKLSGDYDELVVKEQKTARNLKKTSSDLNARSEVEKDLQGQIANLEKSSLTKNIEIKVLNEQLRDNSHTSLFSFKWVRDMQFWIASFVIVLIIWTLVNIVPILKWLTKFLKLKSKPEIEANKQKNNEQSS